MKAWCYVLYWQISTLRFFFSTVKLPLLYLMLLALLSLFQVNKEIMVSLVCYQWDSKTEY